MENAHTFTVRLQELLRRERFALADLLVALAEFDRQRLWLDRGHASLFYFLHRDLGLSKGAAFYRKTAAELIQRFPEIVEPLREGKLCLTTVVELSKVLTPDNRDEVLPRFFQLSKTEAKVVTAEICPVAAAPHRDVVTAVRTTPSMPALAAPDLRQAAVHPADQLCVTTQVSEQQPALVHPANQFTHDAQRAAVSPASSAQPQSRALAASVEPLTGESSRLHVTVSRAFVKKLEAARAALSHSHPGAGMEEILEAGLDLLLDRHAKRKGIVKRPLRQPRASKPGHVPAHVLRAVWERDAGKCQWALASGGICGSAHRVEVDHRHAKALGGPPTVENLRCLCKLHNDQAARQTFGDGWMDRYTRGRRGSRASGIRPPTAAGTAPGRSPS